MAGSETAAWEAKRSRCSGQVLREGKHGHLANEHLGPDRCVCRVLKAEQLDAREGGRGEGPGEPSPRQHPSGPSREPLGPVRFCKPLLAF